MYRLIILCVVFNYLCSSISAQTAVKEITIDTQNFSTLKISEIGDVWKIIPLEKTSSENFLSQAQVLADENFIFLTFGTYPLSVLQYDLNSGKLIRIIGKDKSGKDLFDYPVVITNDTKDNKLFIKCRTAVYSFNYLGKMETKYHLQGHGELFFHNNEFWAFSIDFTGKGYDVYSLYSQSKLGEEKTWTEIIHNRNARCEPASIKITKDAAFWTNSGVFYFSNGTEPDIYKYSNSNIIPFCNYSFVNGNFSCQDKFNRRHTLLGEDWLIVNYRMHSNKNSFFYQFSNNKQYNIKNGTIEDDLFGTQEIKAKQIKSMRDGYFCFTIQTEKIKSGLITTSKNAGRCLVIMKVKQ